MLHTTTSFSVANFAEGRCLIILVLSIREFVLKVNILKRRKQQELDSGVRNRWYTAAAAAATTTVTTTLSDNTYFSEDVGIRPRSCPWRASCILPDEYSPIGEL